MGHHNNDDGIRGPTYTIIIIMIATMIVYVTTYHTYHDRSIGVIGMIAMIDLCISRYDRPVYDNRQNPGSTLAVLW